MPKKEPPKIYVDNDNFQAVLNCAVRYALGRETYMPHLVISFITPLIPYLDNRTLYVFKQDLESTTNYGDPNIDAPAWKKFLELITNELSKR